MRFVHKAAVSLGALLVSLGAATPALAFDSGSAPDHDLGCMYFVSPLASVNGYPDVKVQGYGNYGGFGELVGMAEWDDGPAYYDFVLQGSGTNDDRYPYYMSDAISAVYVSPGCHATLWWDHTKGGSSTRFPPGFYDLSGNTWNDKAGSAACTCTDPRITPSFSFNGYDQYAEAPSGTWFTSAGFTISAWVKVDATTNWSRVIDFGEGPHADNVLLAASHGTTGKPAFHVYNGSSGSFVESSVAIPTGTWTHLAAVYDASHHGYLYMNGDLVASASNMVVPNAVTRTKNYIGRSNWSPDAHFDGSMAHVRIFDYAMSDTQVMQLVAGSDSYDDGEEAHYMYQGGSGDSTLYDMSRNHQDATFEYP